MLVQGLQQHKLLLGQSLVIVKAQLFQATGNTVDLVLMPHVAHQLTPVQSCKPQPCKLYLASGSNNECKVGIGVQMAALYCCHKLHLIGLSP